MLFCAEAFHPSLACRSPRQAQVGTVEAACLDRDEGFSSLTVMFTEEQSRTPPEVLITRKRLSQRVAARCHRGSATGRQSGSDRRRGWNLLEGFHQSPD